MSFHGSAGYNVVLPFLQMDTYKKHALSPLFYFRIRLVVKAFSILSKLRDYAI